MTTNSDEPRAQAACLAQRHDPGLPRICSKVRDHAGPHSWEETPAPVEAAGEREKAIEAWGSAMVGLLASGWLDGPSEPTVRLRADVGRLRKEGVALMRTAPATAEGELVARAANAVAVLDTRPNQQIHSAAIQECEDITRRLAKCEPRPAATENLLKGSVVSSSLACLAAAGEGIEEMLDRLPQDHKARTGYDVICSLVDRYRNENNDLRDALKSRCEPRPAAVQVPGALRVAAGERYCEMDCEGLSTGDKFEDPNDPGEELSCHETGRPLIEWCAHCLLHATHHGASDPAVQVPEDVLQWAKGVKNPAAVALVHRVSDWIQSQLDGASEPAEPSEAKPTNKQVDEHMEKEGFVPIEDEAKPDIDCLPFLSGPIPATKEQVEEMVAKARELGIIAQAKPAASSRLVEAAERVLHKFTSSRTMIQTDMEQLRDALAAEKEREPDGARLDLEDVVADLKGQRRQLAQSIIEEIGAPGPESIAETVGRAIGEIADLKRQLQEAKAERDDACQEIDAIYSEVCRWKPVRSDALGAVRETVNALQKAKASGNAKLEQLREWLDKLIGDLCVSASKSLDPAGEQWTKGAYLFVRQEIDRLLAAPDEVATGKDRLQVEQPRCGATRENLSGVMGCTLHAGHDGEHRNRNAGWKGDDRLTTPPPIDNTEGEDCQRAAPLLRYLEESELDSHGFHNTPSRGCLVRVVRELCRSELARRGGK